MFHVLYAWEEKPYYTFPEEVLMAVAKDFGKWLATMPPPNEQLLEERISDTQSELAFLHALLEKARTRGHQGDDVDSDHKNAPTLDELRKRMSPERLRIIRTIAKRPNREASIPEVAKALNVDRDNVASNMQRMVSAGLLERVVQGRYVLTAGAAELLGKIEGGEIEI
jgi:DNA-binding IclR family transcriptional regulator